MTLKQFIKEHRAELDACIARALGLDKTLSLTTPSAASGFSTTRVCISGRGVKE